VTLNHTLRTMFANLPRGQTRTQPRLLHREPQLIFVHYHQHLILLQDPQRHCYLETYLPLGKHGDIIPAPYRPVDIAQCRCQHSVRKSRTLKRAHPHDHIHSLSAGPGGKSVPQMMLTP